MIKTTNKYWDCECKDFYIRPAQQDECGACGAMIEDQPDSRVDEVRRYLQRSILDLEECMSISIGRYEINKLRSLYEQLNSLENELD